MKIFDAVRSPPTPNPAAPLPTINLDATAATANQEGGHDARP